MTTLAAPADPGVRFVDVPARRLLEIAGRGAPDAVDGFQAAIRTLYPVAWTLHFALRKRGVEAPVGALEALWDGIGDTEAARRGPPAWVAIIAVPVEATEDEVDAAIAEVRRTKKPPLLDRLRVIDHREGLCAEIVHVGPYADEEASLVRLRAAVAAAGRILSGPHHEIYLGDPNRTRPERLRTLIRYPIT